MKGQFTITGIIFAFLGLILLAALFPAIYAQINNITRNATANGDTTTAMIAPLFPIIMVFCIILVPVVYTLAGRSRGQEGEV